MEKYDSLKKNLYLLLADVFDYPEEKFFKIDKENPLLLNLGLLKKYYSSKRISKFFDRFFICLEKTDKREFEEIKLQHFRLFKSPYAVLPPYASFFLNGELFGEVFWKMKKKLLEEGYILSPTYGNTEDYISCELEYIYLIYEEKEKLRNFLNNHFILWFKKFYKKSMEHRKVPLFYKLNIKLLKYIIEEDKNV